MNFFGMIWNYHDFFKMKHKICTKYAHFYKIIFTKMWLRKKCDLLGKF